MRLTAIATLLAAAGLTAFAAPAALAGDACPYSASKASMAKAKHTGDIVHVAADAGQFSTLLAAAKAAGLAETLAGEGPYTVFAPHRRRLRQTPRRHRRPPARQPRPVEADPALPRHARQAHR